MAAQKLEQRRLHMLTKQREQLESELEALQDEVADLVRVSVRLGYFVN